MLYYCPHSQNARQIFERFVQSIDHYSPLFLAGPKGSDFQLLIKEYAGQKGITADYMVHLCPGMLEASAIATLVPSLEGKVPKIIAVSLTPVKDATQAQQIIEFLKHLPFPDAKWVITMDGWDPDDVQGAYLPALINRAKRGLFVMPPLKDRAADLAYFAIALLQQEEFRLRKTRELTFSKPAVDLLLDYTWPGNFDELEQTMRLLAHAQTRPVPISRETLEITINLGRTSEFVLPVAGP